MSAHLLLLLPLVLPLFGAIVCLFFWRLERWQALVSGIVQLGLLAVTVLLLVRVHAQKVLSTQVGSWSAPFGITMVADTFSALILVAAAVVGLAVFFFSVYGLDKSRQRYGYFPLMLFLQMGVGGVCLTGDLFNLYVWFELILICCFALLSLGGTKLQLEGALKYVTINFIASGLLLTGTGVMYSLFGALNLAELALLVREGSHPNLPLLRMASVFFLTGFGIKAAVFPMFFWLPASYHTAPIAISAFIAGLITKVGVYTLIRLYTLIFITDQDFMLPLLVILSGCTMVVGVIGAAAQNDFRRILSFHIISQIGYMLMGLAIYTPLAIAGSIFFIIHNILVKTNLFLVSGIVAQYHRSFSLPKLGSVYLQQPFIAILFLISALSLAGTPPLSGFWGKFMLAKAGFEAGNYLLVTTSLCVSLVTLFSMTKIWNEVFWKPKPRALSKSIILTPAGRWRIALLYIPVVFLCTCVLAIGVCAGPLVEMAMEASQELFHIETYTNTVLGITD